MAMEHCQDVSNILNHLQRSLQVTTDMLQESFSHDLLKIDSKGWEFALTKTDLENVQNLKIEYMPLDPSHNISNLIKLIKNSNFQLRLFTHAVDTRKSFKTGGNILATKAYFPTNQKNKV